MEEDIGVKADGSPLFAFKKHTKYIADMKDNVLYNRNVIDIFSDHSVDHSKLELTL